MGISVLSRRAVFSIQLGRLLLSCCGVKSQVSLSVRKIDHFHSSVLSALGARFSKVPVTLRTRNQIFKSKYKE